MNKNDINRDITPISKATIGQRKNKTIHSPMTMTNGRRPKMKNTVISVSSSYTPKNHPPIRLINTQNIIAGKTVTSNNFCNFGLLLLTILQIIHV